MFLIVTFKATCSSIWSVNMALLEVFMRCRAALEKVFSQVAAYAECETFLGSFRSSKKEARRRNVIKKIPRTRSKQIRNLINVVIMMRASTTVTEVSSALKISKSQFSASRLNFGWLKKFNLIWVSCYIANESGIGMLWIEFCCWRDYVRDETRFSVCLSVDRKSVSREICKLPNPSKSSTASSIVNPTLV